MCVLMQWCSRHRTAPQHKKQNRILSETYLVPTGLTKKRAVSRSVSHQFLPTSSGTERHRTTPQIKSKTESYPKLASYKTGFTNNGSQSVRQSSIPSHLRLVVEYNLPVGLVAEEGREFVAQVLFCGTIPILYGLRALFVSCCWSENPLSLVDVVAHIHTITKEAPQWSTSSPGWAAAFPAFTCTAVVLRGWRRRTFHSNADRVARSFALSLAHLGVCVRCVLSGGVWLDRRQRGEERNGV